MLLQLHIAMYDPYSYYSFQQQDQRFISPYSSQPVPGPSSPLRRRRRDSIWSTSSICSQDSLDDAVDDTTNDETTTLSPVCDMLPSPISPADSTCSYSSFSSSSSYSPSRSRTSSKPRGPRPLPALPISLPSSPSTTSPSLPPFSYHKTFVPPLRLNIKDLSPPPSYEEAVNSAHTPVSKPSFPCNTLSLTLAADNTRERATVRLREREIQRERPRPHSLPTRPRPTEYPFDCVSPTENVPDFMFSTCDDRIDWDFIQEILVGARS